MGWTCISLTHDRAGTFHEKANQRGVDTGLLDEMGWQSLPTGEINYGSINVQADHHDVVGVGWVLQGDTCP